MGLRLIYIFQKYYTKCRTYLLVLWLEYLPYFKSTILNVELGKPISAPVTRHNFKSTILNVERGLGLIHSTTMGISKVLY